jgi:choline dehydrogenase
MDGELAVSRQTGKHPLCSAFVESGYSLGFETVDDFNRGDQEGLGFYQVTARRGRRVSSAVAFLRRATKRSNVRLEIQAQVQAIVLENKRARGVTYLVDGVTHTAQARKAVVLSAGAINSPAILQRSGIGRPDWLAKAGIAVQHALPGVGDNLQDHLQAKLVYRCVEPNTLNDKVRSLGSKLGMGAQYILNRTGPLTMSAGQAGGFIRSRDGLDRPDVQYHVMPFSSGDLRKGLDSFSGMTISACQLRPDSRGTVLVKNADPTVAPLISPNFLSAENDVRTLLDGLRIGRSIAMAAPMRKALEREERPGVDVKSDEALLDYVRQTAASVFHPAGTCRMGSGPDAVVDAKLRVHGIQGLVVADASIMPTLVSGNTNAASIMIGERAAAFLREAS